MRSICPFKLTFLKTNVGVINLLKPVILSDTGGQGASAQNPEGRQGRDYSGGDQTVGPEETAGSS